ncbi:MAG: hypothetical protein ACPG8F_04840 [Flavobacteriaceae bacterium]
MSVSSGCFAFDVGWLIGSSLSGKNTSFKGVIDAIANYSIHETNH